MEEEEKPEPSITPATPKNTESRRFVVYINPEDRKGRSDVYIDVLARSSPDSIIKPWDTVNIQEHNLVDRGELLVLSEQEILGLLDPKITKDDWVNKHIIDTRAFGSNGKKP